MSAPYRSTTQSPCLDPPRRVSAPRSARPRSERRRAPPRVLAPRADTTEADTRHPDSDTCDKSESLAQHNSRHSHTLSTETAYKSQPISEGPHLTAYFSGVLRGDTDRASAPSSILCHTDTQTHTHRAREHSAKTEH